MYNTASQASKVLVKHAVSDCLRRHVVLLKLVAYFLSFNEKNPTGRQSVLIDIAV